MTLEFEQTLVQQLLASPRLPFYVEQLEFVIPVRAIFDEEVHQIALRQILSAQG